MEQAHFEILLEEMRSNFQLAFEDLGTIKTDVSMLKTDVSMLKTDVSVLKTDVSVLKTDVSVLKTDVRDIKRNMGLINAIASDHEGRLQTVENKLDDHLDGHS